jgi:uncharacterized protein (TIGR03435 family)
MSMTEVSAVLMGEVGIAIVDKTGLAGSYDFSISFPASGPSITAARFIAALQGIAPPRDPPEDENPSSTLFRTSLA